MPTLKQLTCSIELTNPHHSLPEFGTAYADSQVSTFISIPSADHCFAVHLTSEGYIAPGLAVFVYIDGVYQCNRNRRNLHPPGENGLGAKCEVDFHLKQKEERCDDGTFLCMGWRFAGSRAGEFHFHPSYSLVN